MLVTYNSLKIGTGKQISKLKTSVEFCSSKIDKYDKCVGKYERKVLNLEKDNTSLDSEDNIIKAELESLKLKFEVKQYGRKCNVQSRWNT